MVDSGEIRIDMADIMRKLEANGFDEVHIEFVPEGGHPVEELAATLTVAVRAADDEESDTFGEDPVVSVAGGSVRVKDYWDEESLLAWLAVLVREMSAAGFAGLIHATPTIARPRWLRDVRGPRLTAFVAYDETFLSPALEPVAAWCQGGADWTAKTSGDTYISVRGMSQDAAAVGAGMGIRLAQAVRARALTVMMQAQPQVAPVAQVAYTPSGYAIYQVYDPLVPVLAVFDRIRQALLIGAEQLRLGFVAPVDTWAYVWPDRDKALPPLPTVPAAALRLNNPLWRQYVPDAHALQLLTDEHLRHVADLSRWNVRQVAPGRHLVEAGNLDDWFAPGGPPDSVVRQARADFGDAIIPPNSFDGMM
jgi:hypothetical protein